MIFYERNYSNEIRQLAHLLVAVEASQPGGAAAFFYTVYPLTAAHCREFFRTNCTAAGLGVDEKGISLSREGGDFAVSFGRMPFLASYFDQLIEIVPYADIQVLVQAAVKKGVNHNTAQSLSNQLSKKIYDWLGQQDDALEAQRVAKHRTIFKFITSHFGSDEPVINQLNDKTPVVFWQQYALQSETESDTNAGDFKTFEQVANDFFYFYQAQEIELIALRIDQASTIGSDFEAGEINPDTLTQAFADYGEEQGALFQQLTAEPASQVKYYNNTELKLLESIISAGNAVKTMPLTLLRKDVWGSHQRKISEALRRKQPLGALLDVEDLPHYQSYLNSVTGLSDHSAFLLQVIAYALNVSRGGELFDETTELAQAWKKINRQGFKDAVCNMDPREPAWLVGAEVIPSCRTAIEAFLQYLTSSISANGGLEAVFASDLSILRANLTAIYRGAHEQ